MTFGGRITVAEIAKRLAIGRAAVYALLERQIIPAIRLGRRWIITRRAYERWEERCGRDDTVLADSGETAKG
jgi:excisionase family DNA binding protein